MSDTRLVNRLIDGIHRNPGAVEAVLQRTLKRALRKLLGGGPQPPAGWLTGQVKNGPGGFKIVDKRVVVHARCNTRQQRGHLTLKRDGGHFFRLQKRQLVEKSRQTRRVLADGGIGAQHGVVDRLVADGHAGEVAGGRFAQAHGRKPNADVGVEGIIEVGAEQRPNLVLEEVRLFVRNSDFAPGIGHALVNQPQFAELGFQHVIGTRRQRHATRRHLHRCGINAIGQRYLLPRGRLERSPEEKFIFIGDLNGVGERGAVERVEYVLGPVLVFTGLKLAAQIRPERFQNRENHFTQFAVYRHVIHKVEVAIGLRVELLVQFVHPKHVDQLATLQ